MITSAISNSQKNFGERNTWESLSALLPDNHDFPNLYYEWSSDVDSSPHSPRQIYGPKASQNIAPELRNNTRPMTLQSARFPQILRSNLSSGLAGYPYIVFTPERGLGLRRMKRRWLTAKHIHSHSLFSSPSTREKPSPTLKILNQ